MAIATIAMKAAPVFAQSEEQDDSATPTAAPPTAQLPSPAPDKNSNNLNVSREFKVKGTSADTESETHEVTPVGQGQKAIKKDRVYQISEVRQPNCWLDLRGQRGETDAAKLAADIAGRLRWFPPGCNNGIKRLEAKPITAAELARRIQNDKTSIVLTGAPQVYVQDLQGIWVVAGKDSQEVCPPLAPSADESIDDYVGRVDKIALERGCRPRLIRFDRNLKLDSVVHRDFETRIVAVKDAITPRSCSVTLPDVGVSVEAFTYQLARLLDACGDGRWIKQRFKTEDGKEIANEQLSGSNPFIVTGVNWAGQGDRRFNAQSDTLELTLRIPMMPDVAKQAIGENSKGAADQDGAKVQTPAPDSQSDFGERPPVTDEIPPCFFPTVKFWPAELETVTYQLDRYLLQNCLGFGYRQQIVRKSQSDDFEEIPNDKLSGDVAFEVSDIRWDLKSNGEPFNFYNDTLIIEIDYPEMPVLAGKTVGEAREVLRRRFRREPVVVQGGIEITDASADSFVVIDQQPAASLKPSPEDYLGVVAASAPTEPREPAKATPIIVVSFLSGALGALALRRIFESGALLSSADPARKVARKRDYSDRISIQRSEGDR